MQTLNTYIVAFGLLAGCAPAGAQPSIPSIYRGTMETTFQVVEHSAPGRAVTRKLGAIVEINQPLQAGGSAEMNPFHLYIHQDHGAEIGSISIVSTTRQPSPTPVSGGVVAVQDWTYRINGSNFSGVLTSPLRPNANQTVMSAEIGGPLPGTPISPAFMLQGARIAGQFQGNTVVIRIEGSAGTLLGNLAAPIQFRSEIRAVR